MKLHHHPRAIVAKFDLLDLFDPQVDAANCFWRARSVGVFKFVPVKFAYLLCNGETTKVPHSFECTLHRLAYDLLSSVNAAGARLGLTLGKRSVEASVDLSKPILSRRVHACRNGEIPIDRLLTLSLQFVPICRLGIFLRLFFSDCLCLSDLFGFIQALVFPKLCFPWKNVLDVRDLVRVVTD